MMRISMSCMENSISPSPLWALVTEIENTLIIKHLALPSQIWKLLKLLNLEIVI